MQSTRIQQHLDRYLGVPLCALFRLFSRSDSASASDPPKKILFIQLSALGDTILAVPTFRAVRQTYPDAECTLLASPMTRNYLAGCPYIDKHIVFRKPSAGVFAALRRERFEWVIDLEHWPRLSTLLAYATGASRRVGFRTTGQCRHLLFTETVAHVPGRHEVDNFLDIARLIGCPTADTRLEVWHDADALAWVAALREGLSPGKPLVVLHPEAGRRGEPRRRWPVVRYVALANALTERYDAQIVLTGAPDEVAVSAEIAARTRARPVLLAGETDIRHLAALFAAATVVVCGNCGPMHLAAATGTPVVAVHGPTNSAQWGPWSAASECVHADLPCSPCLNLGFEYGCQALPDGTSPCMHTVPVSAVLTACTKYF